MRITRRGFIKALMAFSALPLMGKIEFISKQPANLVNNKRLLTLVDYARLSQSEDSNLQKIAELLAEPNPLFEDVKWIERGDDNLMMTTKRTSMPKARWEVTDDN
jgi:hypothetical protein